MSTVHDLIRKYQPNVIDCHVEPSSRETPLAISTCKIHEATAENNIQHPQSISERGKITVRIENFLRLKKGDLPAEVLALLKKMLTFDNPLFVSQKRFGKLPLKAQPHLFGIWEEDDDLVLARGFTMELIRILNANRIPFDIKDETRQFARLDFKFLGDLNGCQTEAAKAAADQRFGVVVGPPGSGKKVLALKLICDRRLPTLVIVRSKSRMYQWKNAASRFLGLENHEIGLIGDGFKRVGDKLTVAIDRSLYRMVDELKKGVGLIVVDRCHVANLKIFSKAITPFDCPFMLGLSTSVERPDGLTKLMMAYVGPLLAEIRPVEILDGLEGRRPQALIRRTGFVFDYRENYGDLISALCTDQRRNQLIASDILQETAARASLSMVISERIDHLRILQQLLAASFLKSELLTSLTPAGKRREVLEKIERRKLLVVLMTAKGIPDCSVNSINALFVASPLRSGDHLVQALGKLVFDNKRKNPCAIYDYVDEPGVLKASLNGRLKAYRSMGAVMKR